MKDRSQVGTSRVRPVTPGPHKNRVVHRDTARLNGRPVDTQASCAVLSDRAQDRRVALRRHRVDRDDDAAAITLVGAHAHATDAKHAADPVVLENGASSTASTKIFGRNRCTSSAPPTIPPKRAIVWVVMRDSGKVSKTPRSWRITRSPPGLSSAPRAGSATSKMAPDGVCKTVADLSGRSGSSKDGR